jgi:hypothetical protein
MNTLFLKSLGISNGRVLKWIVGAIFKNPFYPNE